MTSQMYRIHFPYCLQPLADGRAILLNRRYKPLGVQSKDHVEYETHPSTFSLKLNEATAAKLSWDGRYPGDGQPIWLYRDSCAPRRSAQDLKAYLDRLPILMLLPQREER